MDDKNRGQQGGNMPDKNQQGNQGEQKKPNQGQNPGENQGQGDDMGRTGERKSA